MLGHIKVGEAAALVFRSVRELLMNTVKHTDVKQATVYMTCTKSLLQIVVRDQGGFAHTYTLGYLSRTGQLRLIVDGQGGFAVTTASRLFN